VTLTGPLGAAIVMIALPLCEASARLVAVTVTGLLTVTVEGARKSIAPDAGAVGAKHGLEPATQIWPTLAFPFAIPSTDHETALSGVPETFAASEMRSAVVTVA
jgi:hypothetical protein